MTEMMNTHTRIGQTLTPQKSPTDAWVDLFESDVSPLALLELLAVGDIPADNPEVAGALRDALVRRLSQTPFPKPEKPSSTINRDSPEFPPTLQKPWPAVNMDSPYEASAYLLGRLIAAAGGIGQTSPDALDIALKEKWTPLVRQILNHFAPAAEQLDSRQTELFERYDETKTRIIRERLPWLHQLTRENRRQEISDWLAVPGINPNVTCEKGTTALFRARSLDILDTLIQGRVDSRVQAYNGMTASGDWEKRVNYYGFTPDMLQSMNERLKDTFSDKSDHIHSEVSQCLGVWLKSTDCFGKEFDCGPDLETLSPVLEEAIGKARIRVGALHQSQEWGVIAYMSMNLPDLSWLPHRKTQVKLLQTWDNFIKRMPSEWLTHESVPGVADGWVLAAGLLNHESIQVNNSNKYSQELFKKLESRMMDLEGPENPLEYRINSIIRACDALLILAADNNDARRQHSSILRDMSALRMRGYTKALWGEPYQSEAITSVIAGCFIKGISLPGAGQYLVLEDALLKKITPHLKKFLTNSEEQQQFLESLLHFYSKKISNTSIEKPDLWARSMRDTFNTALEALCQASLMPDNFTSEINKSLDNVLPYIGFDSPSLHSAIQAKMIDNAIPENPHVPGFECDTRETKQPSLHENRARIFSINPVRVPNLMIETT